MDRDPSSQSWRLVEAIGGRDTLDRVVTDFYERVFADPIIGFMFEDVELEHIVEMQVEYLRARLGSSDVEYTGDPIRGAHESLPITVGHFDRRHRILEEVLDEYDVPERVRDAWLELDASLRDLVIRTGEEARDDMLDGES